MEVQDIEQAYRRLLNRLQTLNSQVTEQDERRIHPRFTVNEPTILVRSEFQVPALDVSVSGISFRSPHRFEVGRHFTIQVGKAISGEAVVISCEPEFTKEPENPIGYRVRCTFAEDTIGMPMVVVLNDQVVGAIPCA